MIGWNVPKTRCGKVLGGRRIARRIGEETSKMTVSWELGTSSGLPGKSILLSENLLGL
jgi:hypothetical protein